MATSTVSPPRTPTRNIVLRVLGIVLAIVVIALLVVAGWVYGSERAELPQQDGVLVLPALSAPVTVIRDGLGIPHIRAVSDEDLFIAQGFVTAQDRLWQMDISRRYAGGELAEILGPGLIHRDMQQRYLQLRATCERAVSSLDPQQRRMLEAYARGVNAFIDRSAGHLPLEFKLLGYKPGQWKVMDSLLIGANMDQMLNTQYDLELKREKVVKHLMPQEVADLYPSTSWRDLPPATQAHPQAQRDLRKEQNGSDVEDEEGDSESMHTSSLLSAFSGERCDMCVPGSNNWVVSGEHTATGKPMLSNDMHLDHSIPDIWYTAQLTKGDGQDYDVTGVTLPGLPFVIVGHNRRIAWGFTNLGPDVQDLFVETFNSAGQVATPQGWQQPQRVHEVIHVKGKPDESFDVVVTRHGPIITPILKDESRQLALQWTLYDVSTLGIPFQQVNSARNWTEFRQAFSHFGGPSQNVVYADVDGHIGYQATGKIPIRASGDGLVPQPGSDAAHDWTGYVPFDQLPSVYDPPSGFLATANGRITPDGYKPLLANIWFAPYRTDHIVRLLDNGSNFKPADMLAIQTDVQSEFERFFADRFVYAIDHGKNVPARVKQAAEIMRGWDGQMSKESAAPTISYWSRRNLTKLLLSPKLGDDFSNYDWGLSGPAMENIVSHKLQRWLPPGYGSFDEVLIAGVQKTVEGNRAPKNLSSWHWGDQFPVEVQHPVFGSIPVLKHFSGTGSHPQSGSGTTVKQVGYEFGPSERLTVDFSNLDRSTLNIVIGESGHLLSPHYKDQFPAWYGDTTFPLPFSDAAVKSAAKHTLELRPQ